MASGIYCILNTVNGKCYIGQAKCFNHRWSHHRYELKKGTHHCRHLQSAWKKYGGHSFSIFVLENMEDLTQLTSSEQFWIDYFRFLGTTLYNTSKVSASPNLGIRRPKSREAVEKTLATKRRNGTTGKGRKMPQEAIEKRLETRRKNGITNLGRKHSPEAMAKMRGRKKSPETVAKRLEDMRRRGVTNKGKKQSPETIAKRVETRRRNKALRETPHLVPTRD